MVSGYIVILPVISFNQPWSKYDLIWRNFGKFVLPLTGKNVLQAHVIYSDLQGLLMFLGTDPYWEKIWWHKLLYQPYCHGNTEPMITNLSRVLWRTAKKDVEDQVLYVFFYTLFKPGNKIRIWNDIGQMPACKTHMIIQLSKQLIYTHLYCNFFRVNLEY